MKSLVVYYSRTGNTKKIAEIIAEKLDADIEEIIDLKKRKGVFGYLISGIDALTKKLTEIKKPGKNPEDYDLVIIGTPVWAGTMVPAIRTYLDKHKIRKSAFFCTCAATGINRTFTAMLSIIVDTKLIAKLGLTASDMKKGTEDKIGVFVNKLKAPA